MHIKSKPDVLFYIWEAKNPMQRRIMALKAAFPHTVPVLTGFLCLGAAYGILMASKGQGFILPVLFSLFTFAGSMQFVAITLLTSVFNPVYAFLLTLMVNARHLFYGVSMLKKLSNTGKFKPYLIFAMCDETFSILCSVEPPENADRNLFMFFISVLDQSYWVIGTLLGALLGSVISFDTSGIEFVMTAMFTVIFINQWRECKNHFPAVIGVLCSLVCLLIFKADNFIIPAMISIVAVLTIFRKRLDENVSSGQKENGEAS